MNIHDDPQTIPLATLRAETVSRQFVRDVLGHYFDGHDGLVYRVIGYRENDGPWIEEIFGRAPTRTISDGALHRSFHHHKKCSVEGCRAHQIAQNAGRVLRGGNRTNGVHWTTEWSGVQQETDGKTFWVNGPDGMCIGRLSPAGIDIHGNARAQAAGAHCCYCEPGLNPFEKSVTFPMYVRFVEKMKEHHNVEIARIVPIRISPPPPLV